MQGLMGSWQSLADHLGTWVILTTNLLRKEAAIKKSDSSISTRRFRIIRRTGRRAAGHVCNMPPFHQVHPDDMPNMTAVAPGGQEQAREPLQLYLAPSLPPECVALAGQ